MQEDRRHTVRPQLVGNYEEYGVNNNWHMRNEILGCGCREASARIDRINTAGDSSRRVLGACKFYSRTDDERQTEKQ